MNVRLLVSARLDSFDIAEWYENRQTGLGDRFLRSLQDLVDNLAIHPRLHGRVTRSPKGREIRQARVSGFSIVATYEVTASEAVILSIVHARSIRQPWRKRLPDPP